MKKFRLLSLIVALLLSASLYAFQKETREVKEFTKIALAVPGDLHLTIGNTQSVVLEGGDIDEIETVVENGTLKIKKENGWDWGFDFDEVDIYITVKSIEGLKVSGSGSIRSESVIKGHELELAVSGSGDMELAVDVDELEIRISGSGDMELEGFAKEMGLKISGSGDIEAEDLEVDELEARISGSGSCEITVNKSIDASIAGSGEIHYKGSPSKVNSHSSGSGEVKKM